jgi:hypothetical protein
VCSLDEQNSEQRCRGRSFDENKQIGGGPSFLKLQGGYTSCSLADETEAKIATQEVYKRWKAFASTLNRYTIHFARQYMRIRHD